MTQLEFSEVSIDGAASLVDENGEIRDLLSIADLYDDIDRVLRRAFPHRIWIKGEIQAIKDHSSGHCYIDLVDPGAVGQAPTLKVKCWRSTWAPLRKALFAEGIELDRGMVVTMCGELDFYKPRAEVGFSLAELDVTALVGRLAVKRAQLIKKLTNEGVLKKNKTFGPPLVPLVIGLVASPGTEGYRDFLGQLVDFGFHVIVSKASVQGNAAPMAIAAAIENFKSVPIDVLVIVRGGGSKADLAAFDEEEIARAIGAAEVPVWTGIGHTGDESIADLAANRAFITPTQCGQAIAAIVAEFWEYSVLSPAHMIAQRASEVLFEALARPNLARKQLVGTARHLLFAENQRLSHSAISISVLAKSHLDRGFDRALSWRRLLCAYDVQRQLERGYAISLDETGKVLRSIADVGEIMTTRLADGTIRSKVEERNPA